MNCCYLWVYFLESGMNALSLKRYLAVIFLSVGINAHAVSLDEAKEMYIAGDYASALPVFESHLKKDPRNASLNHWMGVCLLQSGQVGKAIPLLEYADKKGIVEAPRYLAEIAYRDYRLDDADSYMEHYRKALDDARKDMPEEVGYTVNCINRMRTMFDRVENIVIIDSISVDRDSFFRYYRLAPESGSLNSDEVLPDGFNAAIPVVVYMTEDKSSMIWSAPDSLENYMLVSSSLLADGQWETPRLLGDALNEGGDANFPFLMSDGVTLYYANDGENTIGGYDIFISRRGEDGFLQPQNIGMPYNSPYNDYMLAIDEVTGVGWWATDRNCIDDKVTIYKFIPGELRINYPVDEPRLVDFARVRSYRDTWSDGTDYSDLLRQIDNINPTRKKQSDDFRLALPGGRIYTSWDDFSNEQARLMMERYMATMDDYEADCKALATMRHRYASGDDSCSNEILSLERKLLTSRESLKQLKNEVIRLETDYFTR